MYFVDGVRKHSLALKAGLKKGDIITHINGEEVTDGLMYGYLLCSLKVKIDYLNEKGEKKTVEIKNDYEDIGVINERPMVENPKSCHNKCIFCFIDQLPKGLREPLYFKDDDSRLSFLTGNYVTLTNVSDKEFQDIIKMRLSPINISVHTTNDELRKKMLNNRFAGGIKEKIKCLTDENIVVNAQIVLCKGFNDKAELESSISDLYNLGVNSVSVVPMGQTKFREGLTKVEPFTKEDAKEVIDLINRYGDKSLLERGYRFIYPADEFFIKAQLPIPSSDYYDDFPQIENGVGMLSSFKDEFDIINFKKQHKHIKKVSKKTVATSYAAYETLNELVRKFNLEFDADIELIRIKNEFFGEKITVAGLLTGKDIINQLKGKVTGKLIVPRSMFRSQGDLTLDGMTLEEMEKELSLKIETVSGNGYEFLEKLYREG